MGYGRSPGVGIWISGSQEALVSEQGLPQVGRGSAQVLLEFPMRLQREDGETQDSLGRPLVGRGGDGHLASPDSHIRVSEHPEAWCQEQGLRWAEGRAQAL